MGIRTLSGAVYVLITTLFFLLRAFIHEYFFYAYLTFFCVVGTFEVSRAVGYGVKDFAFYLSVVFGSVIIPIFVIVQHFFSYGGAVCFLLILIVSFVYMLSTKNLPSYEITKPREKVKTYSPINRSIAFVYPSIFIVFMALLNAFLDDKGLVAMLLLFVISPLTDTMAYLVGMTYSKIRKGNVKKLAPRLSPKKTVAGAIGGLIGGLIGAILVLVIIKPELKALSNPYLTFSIVGVLGSLFTQLGDLFESFIKRSVGIKDMGKIMPGHGGVMDRIDGMCFCSVVIYFAFILF